MIYLDANASEAPRPQAVEAACKVALEVGNPASVHRAGHRAKRHLEAARENIAGFLGCAPENCIFTSGASEANALLIESFAKEIDGRQRQIFAGATEHPSILSSLPAAAKIIPVDHEGQHDLAWLRRALLENRENSQGLDPLICVMAANNETGIYTDISGLLKLAEEFDAFLHLDAVQAFGRGWKVPQKLYKKASFALSGHKMGGFLGAGALVTSYAEGISPIFKGGGQEHGKRGGTPALPAIVALSDALTAAQAQDWQKISALRDFLEAEIISYGGKVIGQQSKRLPNTSSLLLEGISSQAQLMAMDLLGICVSAGSACASGKMGVSPVLKAMGLAERAGQVMRVSLPWNVTEAAVAAFLKAYRPLAQRAQKKIEDKKRFS